MGNQVKRRISHNWDEERIEAKARWFRSLSMEERMRLFSEWTEMLLNLNPALKERDLDAKQAAKNIQVIRKT